MGLENDPDFWKMTLESDSPKRSPRAIAEGEAINFPIVLFPKSDVSADMQSGKPEVRSNQNLNHEPQGDVMIYTDATISAKTRLRVINGAPRLQRI
jgi:hypothetical protein